MRRFTVLKGILGTAGLAVILQVAPGHAQSADSRPLVPNPAPSAVAPEQLGAWLYYVATELRALRTEMLQLRLDAQEARVEKVEREIQKVRQKKTDLQMEENQRQQQIAEANELAGQQLDPEQRTQLEGIRAELTGDSGNRLHIERGEAVKAEAELLRRLQREKAQYAQVQALLQQILNGNGAAKQ